MLKVLAVLRTTYLVFVVGYTIRAMPPFLTSVARTFDEQYAICSSSLHLLVRAAWLAIAWIALETLVGWIVATRARRPLPSAPASSPPSTPTSAATPPPPR
jgi:hypothetical protein